METRWRRGEAEAGCDVVEASGGGWAVQAWDSTKLGVSTR